MGHRLPDVNVSPEDVAKFVTAALAGLDRTPTRVNWRWRANGGVTMGQILAEVPNDTRYDVRIPVPEARILKVVAEGRGLGLRRYLRRAVGTVAVVCDGVEAGELPSLLQGGLILPWDDDGR